MKLCFFFCLAFITVGVQCEISKGEKLIVTSVLIEPYLMLRNSETTLTGNDRYEGYIVDLLNEIANLMDFNFELTLSADGFYGFLDKNGQWNGMIGDLVSDRAHIAAAPLTITAVRERVVDFTQPFMTLGIAVMHKKSDGNVKDFKSVEELVSQNRVDYGCNYGSATQQFFVNSENQLHKTMLSHMSSNDGKSYVRDSREGMERVMKGDYAFMTESTAIEYAIARECDLYQIGGLLNNKGFGFAVKKQDKGHLRTALSSAILELQERGVLEKLKAKYWQAEQDC